MKQSVRIGITADAQKPIRRFTVELTHPISMLRTKKIDITTGQRGRIKPLRRFLDPCLMPLLLIMLVGRIAASNADDEMVASELESCRFL